MPAQGAPASADPVTQGATGQGLPGQEASSRGAPGQPVTAQVSAQGAPGQSGAVPGVPGQDMPQQATSAQGPASQAMPPQGVPAQAAAAVADTTASGNPAAAPAGGRPQPWSGTADTPAAAQPTSPASASASAPVGADATGTAHTRTAQPLPAEAAAPAPHLDPHSTQGRAISVRTLGQGIPFGRRMSDAQQPQPNQSAPTAPTAPQPQTQQAQAQAQAPAPAQAQAGPQQQPQTPTPPPHATNGSGRRRKLGTRNEPVPEPAAAAEHPEVAARQHPRQRAPQSQQPAQPAPQSRLATATGGTGRSYAIGAPDKNADEGPEPLDGPGGAVEVANQPQSQPMDDELPPEPLDNPRRLLVWPAPDVSTQQALSERGYRPVIVHSREEVAAQIAAFPAALFVDPLTGPITRTALQSLRTAAVAADVPVLVTAGLGQATREAAYSADPAVLLKALAPRDSEQHPPRVLLIEEHAEIALALTAMVERRGMQVARATSDADAVTLAAQMRPNLVVMDLMQIRRRRAGIVDWLRANGLLNRTPLVVYTAAVDQAELPRLAAGEAVLFLAERSTSAEVQSRIVELLTRIGTN